MGKPGGGGLDTKKRVTTISWIPFKEMHPMYEQINNFIETEKKSLRQPRKIVEPE